MKRAIWITLAITLPAAFAAAQDANPVTSAVKNMLQREQQNLVAAAQEMPADKYSFKATPEQMSFGKLVSHTADANNFLCSKIGDLPAPQMPKLDEHSPKDQLVAALQKSFDFCSQALTKMSDAKLSEQMPFFGGRQVSKAVAMMSLPADWADHYSLAATYLRLNGMLPPSAKKKEE